MDHEETPPLQPAVATEEHATPRKRAARREHEFQDDVPHHAAGRTQPDRVAKAL